MKKIIIIVGVIIAFLIVTFWAIGIAQNIGIYPGQSLSDSYDILKQSIQCKRDGGRWSGYGGMSAPHCSIPAGDEGKQCYRQSDCIEDCIYNYDRPEKDSEGFLMGTCGVMDLAESECLPNILKTKTKNISELINYGCP